MVATPSKHTQLLLGAAPLGDHHPHLSPSFRAHIGPRSHMAGLRYHMTGLRSHNIIAAMCPTGCSVFFSFRRAIDNPWPAQLTISVTSEVLRSLLLPSHDSVMITFLDTPQSPLMKHLPCLAHPYNITITLYYITITSIHQLC